MLADINVDNNQYKLRRTHPQSNCMMLFNMRFLTISLCMFALSVDGVCSTPVLNQKGVGSPNSGGQTPEERIKDNLLAEAKRSTLKKIMISPEVPKIVMASKAAASAFQPETHVFLKVPGEAQLVDVPVSTRTFSLLY